MKHEVEVGGGGWGLCGQPFTRSFSTIIEMLVVAFSDYVLCVSLFCIFIFQFIINNNLLYVYNRNNNFYFDISYYYHIYVTK